MALPHDLLDLADHLARREPRRPRQASLRRAVSSAYYGLFHLLIDAASRQLAPSRPIELRAKIGRAFNHRDMQGVCRQFSSGSPADATRGLIAYPIEPELILVARAFVQLQEARHEADYNLSVRLDRFAALQKIAFAREAFEAWRGVRSLPNAAVFLTALLLQARWR